jgi:cobalt-zinc-cadmium efflux system protein
MAHAHSGLPDARRRVWIALGLTGTFMLVEVVGGVISGSLALLADAGHMLTDTMALGLAAVAFRIGSRPPDSRRSYGYARFQILAAFVNGLSLLLIVGWILYEAVERLITPSTVLGGTMLLVAAAGLVVNIVCFAVLHRGDQHNLNIRGAALHVIGDLLGSVAAILAAVVILATGWMPIDPILSILVALLILSSAWRLVRRSAHILLEGVPEGVQTDEIRQRLIDEHAGISDVHHVHIWSLTNEQLMLTMHVVLQDHSRDSTSIVRAIKRTLQQHYAIEHSTIEVETDVCADD